MMFGLSKKEKAARLVEEAEAAIIMGNETLAISKFRESTELYPSNAEAWNNLGAMLGGNNDHAEARDCFEKAIKLNPNYVKAWRGLAVSEKNLEHYDRALEICCIVESLNGSAGDIRADIERRQREHIRPPHGDPTDSTTEFAQKFASCHKNAVADILIAMARHARKEGLLPSATIKNVPELCCEAESVVKSVLSAIEEDCIQRFGSFNPLNLMNVCLDFCIYAGIGATLEWNRNWPELKAKGIFNKLIEAKGIDEMDEYVTELYTGQSFESSAGKKFAKAVRVASAAAMESALNAIVAAKSGDPSRVFRDAVLVSGIASYWFGINFAMYKIVGR